MNDRILVALAVTALIVVVGVATATTVTADDKMTICHKPDGEARTMQVPRSAWSGHEGHGDHEGACEGGGGARAGTSGGSGSGSGSDSDPDPVPAARVTVAAEAEGGVDGEAVFQVTLRNDGQGDAGETVLTGRLRGDGDWRVRSRDADCTIEQRVLTCTLDRLEAGDAATVRLLYDAGARVCHESNVRLTVLAGNDDGADDDEAGASARVGACSALDRPPA